MTNKVEDKKLGNVSGGSNFQPIQIDKNEEIYSYISFTYSTKEDMQEKVREYTNIGKTNQNAFNFYNTTIRGINLKMLYPGAVYYIPFVRKIQK